MAEELQNAEPSGDAGYPDTGPVAGQTIGDGPQDPTDGQSALADGQSTTQPGPAESGQEDTFFDPKDIADKPELMAAYKGMQSAYTKKMQAMADSRHKIEAYDAFYSNPIEQVQRIAQQYGYQLTQKQAADAAQQMQGVDENWQPNNWDDVMERATQIAEQRIMEKMSPLLGQVQDMRKQSIESALTEIDPTWQQYEDTMMENLRVHPTLANNPSMLYRMSVPQEVLESRATQAALKKLEQKQQSAQVSGTSTTHKAPQGGLPDKPVSFQDAVSAAKQVLADQGIRPGG